MKETKRLHVVSVSIQALVWVLVVCAGPLMTFLPNMNMKGLAEALPHSFRMMSVPLLLYMVNYFILIPLFFKDKWKWVFFAANLGYIVYTVVKIFMDSKNIPLPPNVPISAHRIAASGAMFAVFSRFLVIMMAMGVRFIERYYDNLRAEEQSRRQATEAELTMLKNQLNPHFLFNTLNNISSLTQIDADKAQNSIGQLSDLLRYTLYDTEAREVPLAGEVEFLHNYIALMSLRCNEMTRVEEHLDAPSGSVMVAPLLYISLVENAFKHGVNSRFESFVEIDLHAEGSDLVFRCSNSMFEKKGTDRAGSGIGLENLRRRLELIYPERYDYRTEAEDGRYSVTVTLKGIC